MPATVPPTADPRDPGRPAPAGWLADAPRGVAVAMLGPGYGARVTGLDLRTLDKATAQWLVALFYKSKVLSLPAQELDEETLLALSRRFGPLEPHNAREFHHPRYSEVLILSNEREKGRPIGLADGGTYWHTDLAYNPVPAQATVLYALNIPDEGGDTLFTDMTAACHGLPPELREQAEGRRAEHDFHQRPNVRATDLPTPRVQHPVLRTHPVTGDKAVYITPAYTARILELEPDASRALMDGLLAHCLREDYRMVYRWRVGDVVLWDNAAVMHCATTLELPPEKRRTLWRVTVSGTPTF